MKFSTFLVGVALSMSASLLLLSCQKEQSINNSVPAAAINARLSGLITEDPAILNKVPMIISSNFLQHGKELPVSNSYARGKQDNTLPSVSITSPANGATLTGTILIKVTASDNVKVSLVSLGVDGTIFSSTSTSPYTFSWNSAAVPNGSHTLTATAKDGAGNARSVSIQVYTSNVSGGDVTNPTISILSPAGGSDVSGTVKIQVNANDNVGISSVNYSVDGSVIGSSSLAPYDFSWNTTQVSTGIHTLTATAKDAAGNSAANSIQVTVNTVVIPPATLPASYHVSMPPVGNQGGEFSCVSWAVATTRSVERYYTTSATGYLSATNIFSPEYLYNLAKASAECSSGSGIYTCLNIIKNQGICTWQSMPYSDANGCSLLPNSTQLAEAASYKIGSFLLVAQSDVVAIKTLLTQNHSLIAGTSIDNNFTNAKPGFIWTSFSGSYGTNHGYVICGYDDAKHAYKVMNSWGTGWGDLGYTWIDYDFFGTLPGSVYVMQNAL